MAENTLLAGEELQGHTIEEIARLGAQKILSLYLEAEIATFLEQHQQTMLPNGQKAVVRNGYNPSRSIATGAGSITVKVPRSRDRSGRGIVFSSAVVPKYMRRSLGLEEAIPLLHLLGVSSNDMAEGVQRILAGSVVEGLSATNITRLKAAWKREYESWKQQRCDGQEYCYLWADGIHFNVKFDDSRLCTLVLIAARVDGVKKLIAVESGYRESKESWLYVLRDLRDRGFAGAKLAIGDGALGFWQALKEVYPQTRWQRCWVHKTANVLDKLPEGLQSKAKGQLHQIYQAPNRADAEKAFKRFIADHEPKYLKAADCLAKDYDHLLTFYDFPAEHWQHIRSTNVIESTFATVRNRTERTRGHGTIETTLMMVFKLLHRAAKRWRRLRGHQLVLKVIQGVKFSDGIEMKKVA